jgi:deoxyadenosine/deoxycytidine kinase
MVRIVSIAGNIGSGKSTLIEEIASRYGTVQRNQSGDIISRVVTLLEPIAAWTAPALEDGRSMLGAFYSDPAENALAFQTYVLVSRVKQLEDALSQIVAEGDGDSVLILMERGPWVDMALMARPMFSSGMLSAMDWYVYGMLNDMLVARLPSVDAIVYLRAGVADCTARINTRARSDEDRIDAAYLAALHDSHDAYFASPNVANFHCVHSSCDTSVGELADSVVAWFADKLIYI